MRRTALLCVLACTSAEIALQAQQPASFLPPTLPTSAPAMPLARAPHALSEPTTPAKVSWANSQLLVVSQGSSLNGILREITQQTGLKVSGSVMDEPIFGTYGPDTLEDVVASLLKGLPVNLLLAKIGDVHSLILTPRSGGVTPPGSSALRQPDPDDDDSRGTSARQPGPVTAQPLNPGTEEPASPNGVRTPADILRQLQGQRGQPLPPPR